MAAGDRSAAHHVRDSSTASQPESQVGCGRVESWPDCQHRYAVCTSTFIIGWKNTENTVYCPDGLRAAHAGQTENGQQRIGRVRALGPRAFSFRPPSCMASALAQSPQRSSVSVMRTGSMEGNKESIGKRKPSIDGRRLKQLMPRVLGHARIWY